MEDCSLMSSVPSRMHRTMLHRHGMSAPAPPNKDHISKHVNSSSKTLCPSGQGDGLEIHWALPAGARIPSVSICAESVLPAACAAALRPCCSRPLVLPRRPRQMPGRRARLGPEPVLAHAMQRSTRKAGTYDTVPERLRGWTRNPLGSARRGSNPLAVVLGPPFAQSSNIELIGQRHLWDSNPRRETPSA